MEQEIDIEVLVAGPQHEVYVDTILDTIAEAAKVRGTGIAKRRTAVLRDSVTLRLGRISNMSPPRV